MAWIDTEGTFCASKIVKIADRFNLDAKAVLDNILVARTFTHEMMRTALIALTARMSEEPFKLLVIDSIMAHFRVDFTGRGELSERQQKLGQFLSMLNKLADEFNVAVVYTNQVQADPSGMNRENTKYVLRFPNPPPCLPIAQSNYSSTLSHGPKD